MSLGGRFCFNRKGGTGGGGWGTQRVQTTWLSPGSALETPWLWVGHCYPPMHEQVKKTVLLLCMVPISGGEAFFPVLASGCWLGAKLVNGWVWFESRTCRGWLQEYLCEVWRLKTQLDWEYGQFNACIG